MNSLPQRSSRRIGAFTRAFTLVELLVVIGIIAILISILIPAVGAVRKQARVAQTQQLISRLQNSVERYFQDFNAYPGPLSNNEVINGTVFPSVTKAGTAVGITMSENFVLGVLGGLNNSTPAAAPTLDYKLNSSFGGNGPLELGARTSQHPPYFDPGNGEVTRNDPVLGGQFHDSRGRNANDTNIPEILDHFSDEPMPILYYRARVGAHGIISDGVITEPSGGVANYQYDTRQNIGYTGSQIGLATGRFPSHGLTVAEGPLNTPANSTTMNGKVNGDLQPNNGLPFFVSSVDDASQPNYTGTPRVKDGYILISAGPNHVYGSKENIVNFGSFK